MKKRESNEQQRVIVNRLVPYYVALRIEEDNADPIDLLDLQL